MIQDERVQVVELTEPGFICDSTDQAGIYVAFDLLSMLPELTEFIVLIDVILGWLVFLHIARVFFL